MNGKLLDTNVLVRLFNGDKKITDYLWLAAVAKANDFAIVTQDKHLKKIADLSIIEI